MIGLIRICGGYENEYMMVVNIGLMSNQHP